MHLKLFRQLCYKKSLLPRNVCLKTWIIIFSWTTVQVNPLLNSTFFYLNTHLNITLNSYFHSKWLKKLKMPIPVLILRTPVTMWVTLRCRTSTAGHQVTAGGREMSVLIERHFSVHKSTPLYAALRHKDNKSCEGFSIEFNFAYFKWNSARFIKYQHFDQLINSSCIVYSRVLLALIFSYLFVYLNNL